MTVRFAEVSDLPGIKMIWNTCFPGDQKFGEWFFKTIWKAERTLVCFEGNKMAAMLQMLPCEFVFGENRCKATYIYGAATMPEFRRRGLMDKLLNVSFSEDEKWGTPLSVLIPQELWLFDFYRKFSYLPVFTRYEKHFPCAVSPGKLTVRPMESSDIKLVLALYSECMIDRAHVARNADDMLMIFRNYTENGALALCAEEKNQVIATGFGFIQDKTLVLQELLIKTNGQLETIAEEMCKFCSCQDVNVSLIPVGANDVPFACARIAPWADLSVNWDKAYLNLLFN